MEKDITSKSILKKIAKDISTHILEIDVYDKITLIDKEFTRVEKRESDILFENGDKEIIHIEIQNNNHKYMHLRMLRYLSDIYFEYKSKSVKQYLLYIGKEKLTMKDGIINSNLSYNYKIIDIHTIDCEKFLYSDNPSAVALSILCDFKEKDKQKVINTIIKRLKELTDEKDFNDYIEMTSILSTNRNLKQDLQKGVEMFKIDIEKLPFYEDVILKKVEEKTTERLSQVVKKLLKSNISLETISNSTGLSIEKIKEIEDSLNKK